MVSNEDLARTLAELRRDVDKLQGAIDAYRSLEQTRATEAAKLHQLGVTLETERKRARAELAEENHGMVLSIQKMFDQRRVENASEIAALRATQLEKEARDRLRYLTVLVPACIVGLGMILGLPLEAVGGAAAGIYLLVTKGVDKVAKDDPGVKVEVARSKSLRPPAPATPAELAAFDRPTMPMRARSVSYSEIHDIPPSEKIDRTRGT